MQIQKLEDVNDIGELDDEQIQDFLAEQPKEFLRKFAGQLGGEIVQHLKYPDHGPHDDRMQDPKKYGGITEVLSQRSRERRNAANARRGGEQFADHLIDVDN